jgi:hypothetical protein
MLIVTNIGKSGSTSIDKISPGDHEFEVFEE